MQSTKHNCSDELRDLDLRATPARVAVLKFLEKAKEPVDIHDVIKLLKFKKIATDPATVFRMMNTFTQKGITKQVQFHEGKSRYELANREHHHHLICLSCGKIESVEEMIVPQLEKIINTKHKFLVKDHSLEFFGLCSDCQK